MSTSIKKGIFVAPDGKNYLVTTLFLLWGFCNGMIDILNKHFQDSLHINKQQSGLVGQIADTPSMRTGFVVPLVCFVLIAIYGLIWSKLEAHDAEVKVSFGGH